MSQITPKELEDLKEQLDRMHRDQDRVRLIKASASSFTFTSAQVGELVKVQRYGDGAVQTSILLYPKVSDKANFLGEVIDKYDYNEEKEAVKKALKL